MSCLLAIGFRPNEIEFGLRPILNAHAFLPVEQLLHEYAGELAGKAKGLNPETQWFMAVDQQGAPDFDIAYDLPTALHGRLGAVIKAFEQTTTTTTLELFFYDLGTNDMKRCDEVTTGEMRQTLSKLYEKGAPVGSVCHRFKRKVVT